MKANPKKHELKKREKPPSVFKYFWMLDSKQK